MADAAGAARAVPIAGAEADMLLRGLRGKIILPVIIIMIILVVTLTVLSSVKFSNYTEKLISEKIAVTASSMKNFLEDSERESMAAAVSMATNMDFVQAIVDRDRDRIISLLVPSLELYNIGFITVTDDKGIVLARTHEPEVYGDSLMALQNIRDALNGKASTYYEEGSMVKISVRTGAPVYCENGLLVGVISAGVRLDTNEAVDLLKEHYQTEFSVFFGDSRLVTTIRQDGERIEGSHLDAAIAQTVIGEKREYIGSVDVLGVTYNTYYIPLINPWGEVFAILVAGNRNTELIRERNNLIINGSVIGFIGLVVSGAILLAIISRIISPVDHTVRLISEVAKGNVDVDTDRSNLTKDEIGNLTLDVYALIDIVKSLVVDLSKLINELNTYNDIDYRIDIDKYSGAYKEIVSAIETLVSSMFSMNKVKAAMNSIDSMVIVIDMDYNLVYINHSLADVFGLDLDNYKGQKCHMALRCYEQPCKMCLLPQMLEEEEEYPSRDYDYLYDEYSDIWLGGRASIIRWIDGSMVYFQSLNDQSAKKKTQEQLNEAVEAAEAASKAKSAFLANMSHELRTPLNVVIGLADLQLDDEGLPDSVRDDLYKISNAGNTLLSIVNDILDISKIESGEFIMAPVEYYLESLLNDTATLINARIGEKPIKFRLNIEENLPGKLYGDDLRVKQILINLLNNAVKYTHEGFVELSMRCERENDIDVRMHIDVRDTGIGIRPDDLDELFSEFKQVDARANRAIEGTGLGLAITKKLVGKMNGGISVESDYGKGSIFHVHILQGYVSDVTISPADLDNFIKTYNSSTGRQQAGRLVRDDLSYAKVLIVDDAQTNLDVAAGLMRKYHMQVDCVTSGRAAIRRVQIGEPVYDAIFMDHMMPDMDGIETAEKIRELGNDYALSVPIIALTANAVVGTDELFYEHGFQAFISKPIDIMQLDQVIQLYVKDRSRDAADVGQPAAGAGAGSGAGAGAGRGGRASAGAIAGADGVGASIVAESMGELWGDTWGDSEWADSWGGSGTGDFAGSVAMDATGGVAGDAAGKVARGIAADADGGATDINIPGLDIQAGLAVCDGDMKIYMSMLRSYIGDMPAVCTMLRNVCAEAKIAITSATEAGTGAGAGSGALPAYTIAVHGLKGSSANIGAESVRQKAARLEVLGAAGDFEGVAAGNEALVREAENLAESIREWFDAHAGAQAGRPKPLLPAPDWDLLGRLSEFCGMYDYDSADKAMEALEAAEYETGSGLVKWLRDRLDLFEFDDIVERLKAVGENA